jgi:hypothetical protein
VDQDPQGLKNLNALDFIRSIHLGDDCMSTIIYLDKTDFDFLRLQKTFESLGITITMPDKESEPTRYQNIYEEDFLKRHFRYCSDRSSTLGVLDKKSFYKTLLYYLPSKVETEPNQLGQALASILREASLYGRETFVEYYDLISKIVERYDVNVTNFEMTYDDYVITWAVDSGSRHPEYKARHKPFLEKLAFEGKIKNHQQRAIFGKVLFDADETENVYIGHSGEYDPFYDSDDDDYLYDRFTFLGINQESDFIINFPGDENEEPYFPDNPFDDNSGEAEFYMQQEPQVLLGTRFVNKSDYDEFIEWCSQYIMDLIFIYTALDVWEPPELDRIYSKYLTMKLIKPAHEQYVANRRYQSIQEMVGLGIIGRST